MSVLALDPGKNVGWCRSDGSSGVFDCAPYADRGEAIALFARWLSDQFTRTPTMYLAVERPFFMRMSALADFTYGLIWTAHATAYLYDVPRTERRADDVRKWLIGRSRRRKDEGEVAFDAAIMAAVQARGFYPTTPHAADAAALLCMCEQVQVRAVAA